MSHCRHCSHTPVTSQIGRCRDCLLKSLLFALLCWLLWGWLRWDQGQPTSQLAALFGAGGFSLLALAHIGMALRYRRQQPPEGQAPPLPERRQR